MFVLTYDVAVVIGAMSEIYHSHSLWATMQLDMIYVVNNINLNYNMLNYGRMR